MRTGLTFAIVWCFILGMASAQSCPVKRPPKPVDSGYDSGIEPSEQRTISGTIVYHGNLRNWFGLRLDKPMCGQTEFELSLQNDSEPRVMRGKIERARGCSATTVIGVLSFPLHSEHSFTSILLNVAGVVPNPACVPQPELPHIKYLQPRVGLKEYFVTAVVRLGGEGSIQISARSGDRKLSPWQAYASYRFSDGTLLRTTCGNGFLVQHASSKPAGVTGGEESDGENAELDVSPFLRSASTVVMRYRCLRYDLVGAGVDGPH